MPSPNKSPATNPPIKPSPTHPGKIIRRAFLAEAFLNLFTLPLLTHPHKLLPYLLSPSEPTSASTQLFARLFSGLVVGGLTSALLAGATNTRNGIESRRPVYLMLGLGEVVLLPILIADALNGGVLRKGVAWGSVGCLVPPMLWRVWVLVWRPEWLGVYTEVGGEGRGSDGYGAISQRED